MLQTVLIFFDVSGGEIMMVLLLAIILFGPKRIPEITKKIGKVMYEYRKVTEKIKSEIRNVENEAEENVELLKKEDDKNIEKEQIINKS